jgi:hypothetical protein
VSHLFGDDAITLVDAAVAVIDAGRQGHYRLPVRECPVAAA